MASKLPRNASSLRVVHVADLGDFPSGGPKAPDVVLTHAESDNASLKHPVIHRTQSIDAANLLLKNRRNYYSTTRWFPYRHRTDSDDASPQRASQQRRYRTWI